VAYLGVGGDICVRTLPVVFMSYVVVVILVLILYILYIVGIVYFMYLRINSFKQLTL